MMTQAEIAYAARQAWVGFWQTCMRKTGAQSRLSFDEACVATALNGQAEDQAAAPQVIVAALEPRGRPISARDELLVRSTLRHRAAEDHHPSPAIEHKGKSPWAQVLEGDERISGITLSDILHGLDDYFEIFRQVRRVSPAAYAYFRRVGVPLALDSAAVWSGVIDSAPTEPVVNAADMPAYLGLFFPRTKEQSRQDIINNAPAFLDFQLFEKRRRNIAVVAPWKWTIFDHIQLSLDRDNFTTRERRKYPEAGNFGCHWFIGVAPDGTVKALPMYMNHRQYLKNGGTIHHNKFEVPKGLQDWSPKLNADQVVAVLFAVFRAFAATALSGAQLSIRRGSEVARFGIPLSYVRSFFRDRDKDGARRKPILHLVSEHSYERGGRIVTVGEHLRGARRFIWRGNDILITAPGIHHASPEALTAEMMTDDDLLPIPTKEKTIPINKLAAEMRQRMDAAPNVPFRKGQPTARYNTHYLGAVDKADDGPVIDA